MRLWNNQNIGIFVAVWYFYISCIRDITEVTEWHTLLQLWKWSLLYFATTSLCWNHPSLHSFLHLNPSKVKPSYMTGFHSTGHPIPQAAICTLFPRLCLGMLAIPWSRAINGKGFFELEQRKILVMSTKMRWRNCWKEMEEKQNEREGRWWKPHVWPYRI
jgi:hypothetical protein